MAGAKPAGQMRDEKLHAVVARSTISKSKCTKHLSVGPLLEVEMSKKCHAVVARSTFRSQNVQNTSVSDHFWKLRCRKSARRCGAKHISKSKCTKHTIVGPLLEVEMSKKCTPLWREAHFEVKMYKAPQGFGPLLEVQMSLHYTKLHYYTPLHCTATTLHYMTQTLQLPTATTQLHSTTLHYTALHYTT